MSDNTSYIQPEPFEVPEGGLASFLTATVGDWADETYPETGIATAKAAADKLAEYGRYEDTYMVHAAEGETVIPMAVFEENPRLRESLFRQMRSMGIDPDRYVVGNELNSINPVTGQPEFFLKKLFKGLKKAVKSVVKVVKKAAPIILGIGLNMIPGLGAIAAGALGGGISTLAAGGNLRDALKSAAIGGALGGLFKGVQGAAEARKAGDTLGSGFMKGLREGLPGGATPAPVEISENVLQEAGSQAGTTAGTTKASAITEKVKAGAQRQPEITGDLAGEITATAKRPSPVTATADTATRTPSTLELLQTGPVQPSTTSGLARAAIDTPVGFRQAISDAFSSEGGTFLQDMKKAFLPRRAVAADFLPGGVIKGASEEAVEQATREALLANQAAGLTEGLGGIIRQFGPAAAAGTGILAATGGFKQPEMEVPLPFWGVTGQQLLEENPELYRVGPVQYAVPTATAATVPTPSFTPLARLPVSPVVQPPQIPTIAPPVIRVAAEGGDMTRENFPRKNGAISGPGTGTSDDIPAMLSDGEFVFTAKAVRGAGNGNRENGVRKMYQIMRQFESVA